MTPARSSRVVPITDDVVGAGRGAQVQAEARAAAVGARIVNGEIRCATCSAVLLRTVTGARRLATALGTSASALMRAHRAGGTCRRERARR